MRCESTYKLVLQTHFIICDLRYELAVKNRFPLGPNRWFEDNFFLTRRRIRRLYSCVLMKKAKLSFYMNGLKRREFGFFNFTSRRVSLRVLLRSDKKNTHCLLGFLVENCTHES